MIDLLHHLAVFLPFLFFGSIFGSDSSSTATQTSVNSTTQGAQSPSNSGAGEQTSNAPIFSARLGSKIIYNVVPDSKATSDAIAAQTAAVQQALAALGNVNQTQANSASDSSSATGALVSAILAKDQTIAASGASGGQTDFQASLLKIVYVIAGVVAAVFILPMLFGKKSHA